MKYLLLSIAIVLFSAADALADKPAAVSSPSQSHISVYNPCLSLLALERHLVGKVREHCYGNAVKSEGAANDFDLCAHYLQQLSDIQDLIEAFCFPQPEPRG